MPPRHRHHGQQRAISVDEWCRQYYGTDIPTLNAELVRLRRSVLNGEDELSRQRGETRRVRQERDQLRTENLVLRQENEQMRREKARLSEKYESQKRRARAFGLRV
ncbi:unnamed protein product [Cercospora beticola]|nr:unnamed protein product [Cercospora beticola]